MSGIYAINAGGYDKEEKAARAYDLAALKYWGTTTTTNFPVQIIISFLKCNACQPLIIYINIHVY